MPAGPLDDARLKSIEDCLNAGRFDDAQRRLASLAPVQGLGPGVAYLSARLLFHRGRLDAASVASRLRDVLVERPDFKEAKLWLETVERSEAVTEPPPRLATPRIPEGTPVIGLTSKAPRSLGALELPKSELPTEPAPPPDPESTPAPLHIDPPTAARSPWDPLEAALASGKREAVMSSLDKLAARDLDALLGHKTPRFSELAGEVSRLLARAPITRYFAPFDLTLDSVERLDAIVSLLVPPGVTGGFYALRVSLSVYLGECVREASGGTWEGTLAEPESAAVKRPSDRYVPWNVVGAALGEGQSMRKGAGPPPHPAAEPAEEITRVVSATPTPWDPKPWPSLDEARELTRAITSSALGVWAARCLKIPLDRTPASLQALDRYATLLNPRGGDPGSGTDWVRHTAVLTGSYVGELACLHAGGRFSENDAAPQGPLRYEVLLPDGKAVYPLLFAYEKLSGKKPGAFKKFFEGCLGR
ncbi:MAG TPA: hypothetical protein VF103_12100 [Polyangiaceae bacterium]